MNERVEEIGWNDIRDQFHQLNKELAEIIDEMKPSKSMRLYRVKYPFGSEYVRSGKLYLPDNQGTLVALNDPSTLKQVQDDLSYNYGSNPVSFILDKSIELYMPFPDRPAPIPYALVEPGHIFSTSVILEQNQNRYHPAFLWNISAGARSMFMLPKISRNINYRKLQHELGYNIEAPSNIFQHWDLFSRLYKQGLLGTWDLDIIFFSKNWFTELDTKKFLKFKSYMQNQLSIGLGFWSAQHIWNTYFSLINNLSGIRPNPYAYDTVKHLIILSLGALPGIAPATDNSAGPIEAIQNFFLSKYKLDKYLPIVMQPKKFNPYKKSEPIYYSLQYPIATELSPSNSDYTSAIIDLYEIKNLLNLYLRKMTENNYNISDTAIADIPQLVSFDFFHSTPKNYRDIQPCELLFKNDENFSTLVNKKEKLPNQHPTVSTFVRGCIRIQNKSHE